MSLEILEPSDQFPIRSDKQDTRQSAMVPKQLKRKRPTSLRTSPSKFRRLESAQREDIPRPLSRASGISALSTEPEWLPDEGKLSFAQDILACDNDNDLHAVFWNLVTGLLYQMKTTSRKTSVSSSPQSLSVYQSRDSKFRETCLQRDKYKCMVTKEMDINHWGQIDYPSDVLFGDVEAAHIIPFTSTVCINSNSQSALLMNYVQKTLHVYTLKTFHRFPPVYRSLVLTDGIVTMQHALDSENVNPPSPIFLDCHRRIAEVLNVSRMEEVIEKLTREWEVIKLYEGHGSLDSLGRSDVSRILETALWQSVCG
ncbi:hypothetical protein AJ78_04141 [Emergomyces pasteurianus Ep9510]|uniref:HNH nuclease domain-containing protein n=1 Tax=Emergomyces pasteurianus Ep9510 TaxID=1447872 RepID=A0A1J9QK84_9EURO|nr:hypothetical protein AJ78_04141 [Emergomyces pasteurianus Ep9510]